MKKVTVGHKGGGEQRADVGGEREKEDDQVEVRNKTRNRVELVESGSAEGECGGEINTVQESKNDGRDQRHVEGVCIRIAAPMLCSL